MVRVDKPYVFEGQDGKVGLLDLFEGRSQLVMHHFMWTFDVDADGTEHPRDTACPNCSSIADGIGKPTQLHARNTSLVAVSRGPYDKIAAFRERMGWTFPWYSSYGSDFNYDFHATVDDRVAPALVNFRTRAELAQAEADPRPRSSARGSGVERGARTPGAERGRSAGRRSQTRRCAGAVSGDAFEDRSQALAAADAHRLQAVPRLAAAQLVQQRREDAGAGRAHRVAE